MAPFETPLSSFHFPPGVRFHPSDEELIVHYLLNKVNSHPLPAVIIAEIELYNYNPWDLPRLALFGEDEWFFFSPRDRKYPNGVRPNRTTSSGYWKATGTDKPILSSIGSRIGVKKALVFYTGKAPKGVKSDWIMIEYRLPDRAIQPSRSAGSMRLDDWVLCRIRKKGNMSKNEWKVQPSPSGHLSSNEELPSVLTNHKIIQEFYSNYSPPKDCPTFTTQVLPSIEDIQKITYQISSGGNTGFNSTTGNPNKGSGYESLHQATKITHEKETDDVLQVNTIMGDGTGFYNQFPSYLGDGLKDISSNTIVNGQGLNISALSERFLQ